MEYEADLVSVAAAIGNRARTAMLDRLLDGGSLPASELAAEASIALSTASSHLETLRNAGLVVVERASRQRRYRIAGPDVARAIEALAVVAPRRPVTSLRAAKASEHIRAGRTCYDHLAGRLGVRLTDSLIHSGALRLRGGAFSVTRSGELVLRGLGIDLPTLRSRRRALAIPCLDWTEGRMHLAGALGAALCERLLALGLIERRGSGRAVALTRKGIANLERLGLDGGGSGSSAA